MWAKTHGLRIDVPGDVETFRQEFQLFFKSKALLLGGLVDQSSLYPTSRHIRVGKEACCQD